MTPALELVGASVEMAGRPVLIEASVAAAPGEVLGVIGANGSGKTTLLRAALGVARLSAGEARLAGRPAGALSEIERAGLAGYLPQERRVAWNMPAWRIAALGAAHRGPGEARVLANEALAEVGLARLAGRGVRDMSGGERARVLLARLLVTRAPLLVADEPAAGLDPDAALRIMEILARRADAGAAVVVTLHDLTLAARNCHRLAVMSGGRVIALAAPREALDPTILEAAFALQGEIMDTSAGPVVAVRRAAQGLEAR
ncbi:MAG TPA: ABC transporter ATP-binding protein [Caulobacteraceae bacterium]|nr:ABC transporter ATP-binding protein [Caulobacteraceae bacterium]